MFENIGCLKEKRVTDFDMMVEALRKRITEFELWSYEWLGLMSGDAEVVHGLISQLKRTQDVRSRIVTNMSILEAVQML